MAVGYHSRDFHAGEPKKPGLKAREAQFNQAQRARSTYEQQTNSNWLGGQGSIYGDPAEEQALDARVGRARNALKRQQNVAVSKPALGE